MQMSRTLLAGIFLSAAIAFAGCSSGGYGTSPGDSYPYASIPAPGTASVVLSSEMQTLPLPTSAGYGGTLQFARATSGVGASVNVDLGIAPPFGTGTPVLAPTGVAGARAPIPYIYIAFTPDRAVTLSAFPSFSFTLPAEILPTGTLFLGSYDPANPLAGYRLGVEGPVSPQTNSAVFLAPTQSAPTWQAKQTYAFVLYGIPTPSPSPSPT